MPSPPELARATGDVGLVGPDEPAESPGICMAPDASPLVVRVGSTMVATDALLAHADDLAVLAEEAHRDAEELRALALETTGAVQQALDWSCQSMWHVSDSAFRLAGVIEIVRSAYTWAEMSARDLMGIANDWQAANLGLWARAALPGFILTQPIRAWLWHRLPGQGPVDPERLQEWLGANPQVYTNPEFVELVRRVVTGADDAALGFAGFSPLLLAVLGPRGLGILGVQPSAHAVMTGAALTGAPVLRETDVRIARAGEPETASAPVGAAGRFDRIPLDDHVRIELHGDPANPDSASVYIAPTKSFDPTAADEPWDLTSNIAAVAGMSAGSQRAVEMAMRNAGLTADTPVVIVGYSQGALIAERIAASGVWNVRAVETYGGPSGGTALDPAISGLAIRHTDDLVTALGGPHEPGERIAVERRAFPAGAAIPTADPLPGHQRTTYAETAALLDAARSPQVRAQLDAVDALTGGGAQGDRVTVLTYRAERVPFAEQPLRTGEVSGSAGG